MCCLKCCFWCLEKFIKFLNRNAYIMVSTTCYCPYYCQVVIIQIFAALILNHRQSCHSLIYYKSSYVVMTVLYNVTWFVPWFCFLYRLLFMGKTSACQPKMLSCCSWETSWGLCWSQFSRFKLLPVFSLLTDDMFFDPSVSSWLRFHVLERLSEYCHVSLTVCLPQSRGAR